MARLADYRVTAVLFILTISVLVVMQGLFPSELAAPLPGANVRSPVMLYELATEPGHLDYVFGAEGDPERASRIAAMDAGNRLDYLLMPLYGFFVFSFLAAISRELGDPKWRTIGALGLVAAASDAVENALLLAMTADFSAVPALLPWLTYPVWIKFGLLALTCGAAAIALWRARRRVLALLCLPAPLLIVPGILMPFTLGSIATACVGLGWIAMGIHAAHRSFRPIANPAI